MKDIKLRLVYYFWIPKNGFNEMHELHFKCLEKYSNLFDESIFFIAVDDIDNKDMLNIVKDTEKRLFNCGFIKNVTFNVIYNNEMYREGKIFKEEIVDKFRERDGLTFFAHTKGVSTYNINIESNKLWVAAMYYFNLNFINDVIFYLNGTTINSYGFFRCFDTEFKHIKNRWMYCGTFMWLNCPKIYNYIISNNIIIPELYDKGYAEDFLGNIIPWTFSSSKGKWVTKNQDMYNNCKSILNFFVNSEDELNEFYKFYNNVLL